MTTPDWEAITRHINEYIADYTLDEDSGSYTPTEQERLLIEDAIMGLLADEEFLKLLRMPIK